VEQTATDAFHPEAYRDEVKERTLALMERKIQGQEIAVAPTEQPRAQVIDLMEALKASLAAAKPATAPAEAGAAEAGAETEARKPARRAPRDEAARGRAAKK
jgi:DNA end-binding protein Ku